MADVLKRMTAKDAYQAVASKEGLLYHIAHARKENSAEDYDGEQLKRISAETVGGDIDRMRAASELFRKRSIPRG